MTFATFHQHHSTSFHVPRPARFVVALLASTALTVPPALAGDALPTGGQVVSGAVSIGTSGTATTIVQGSDKAIVNWTGFSVGAGNAVNIVQPGSSSALLNRVTGATTSTIAGSITANGQVYLINPNGIAITSTGSVKVGGGFVASTLDMSNEDFLAGRNTFKGNGASAGVSNAGIITVGRGGYAALIGGTVKNDGLIAVPLGKVGLGSGEQATLDLSGDGFLQVAVPTEAGAEGPGALIESAGTVSAEGGMVVMRAATARNAARNAINLSGVVEARSVSGRDGEITLGGGEGGKVALSGKVRATSASGKGGKITVTAKDIALKGATVDASGATGGGTVKIGGDRQGSGTTPHAETVSIDAQSAIHADATETGKGGSVVVWSDGHTGFAGLITARGAGAGSIAGANAGTGGEVEVSGKALLDYTGFTDLSGPGGFGTLLLDPYNVTISSGAASNASGTSATGNDSVINAATLVTALSAANVTITTGASGSAGSQAGNITVADAVTWTSGSALTLSAYGSITLNANLSGGTGATVVLRADNSATGTGTVSFGSGATVTASGGVSIFYNPASYASPTSYSGNMGSGTSVTAFMLVNTLANLQAINTNLSDTYALGTDIDASATATWNGGAGFSPIGNGSYRFTGMFDGQGHIISGLTINRGSDYVGLFGYSTGTVRNVGLVGGSVRGGFYVGGLVGYNDGGSISNAYVTGGVAGILVVGGLIGYSLIGQISNAYATGSVSSSGDYVGGLIGFNDSGSISASFFDTQTTGQSNGVGYGSASGVTGLTTAQARDSNSYTGWDFSSVWYQSGDMRPILRSEAAVADAQGVITIANLHQLALIGTKLSGSYVLSANLDASATSGSNASDIWGTAGWVPLGDGSNGFTGTFDGQGHTISGLTIDRGKSNFVGLFGQSSGTVRNVGLAGGSVAGGAFVGGLVGWNVGSISNAYATGSTAGTLYGVGGVVGLNDGSISDTYATGSVTFYGFLYDASVGGLVGFQRSGSISNAYATGTVTANGDQNYILRSVGGLVGRLISGSISNSYALGSVVGNGSAQGSFGSIGGLVGSQDGGSISNSYATGSVRGDYYIGGLVGSQNGGSISNSYATGSVTFSWFGGGLIGDRGNGTITASFFDKETTGQSNGVGSGSDSGVTGLTTAQMSSLSTFAGASWDIDDNGGTGSVWRIYDGYTTPLLRSFMSALTITGGAGSKTYDGTATSTSVGQLTYSNSGYDASQISGTAIYTSSSANAGTYSNATLSGLYSGQSGYDITLVGGALSVTKAALTVTATNASKTYDGLSYSGGNGVDYTGFVTGETVAVLGGSLAIGGTSQGAVNAGSYTLTASGLTSDNYTIGYGDGTLSVNKAALTVTAKDAAKTYDGLSYSGGNGVDYTGFVTGETVAVLGGSLTYGGTSQTAVNAGSYTLTASGLTSDNYTIAYGDGTLSVNKAALTVTAKDAAKTYDGLTYSGGNGVDYIGLVHSETASVLGGSLAYGGTSQTAVNAGSYTLTASGLTSSNYTIAYGDGTLAVNKAALTVTATNAAKTYDGLAYSGGNGVTYSGFVNGQTETVLGGSVAYSGNAQTAENAGSYTLSASGLTSSNYAITYADGALTVNKAALMVTANATTKTYDGLAYSGGNGVTYSGFVDGQTETVLGGSVGYGGTSQGAENAGSYTLTATGLTSGNYAITYADGALTVNKAALTVTANNQTRLFNLQNPALTWTISAGALFQGDTLTGALSSAATTASPVGDYAISRGSLAASQNYDLAFLDGVLSVTPVPSTALSGQFTNGIGLGSNTSASGPAAQIVVIGSAATSPDLATNSLGCAGDPDPTVACAAN